MYEIRRGDRLAGPYTSDEIRDMAAHSLLRGDDLIRQVGTELWSPLSNVKGIPVAQSHKVTAHEIAGAAMLPSAEDPQTEAPGASLANSPEEAAPGNGDATSGGAGVALGIVGGLFVLLGIADFALYNLKIWDVYRGMGIAGTWVEYVTPIIAMVIGSLLMGAGKEKAGLPSALQWVLASIAMVALLVVGGFNLSGNHSFSSSDLAVVQIRGGTMEVCPQHTLGAIVDSYLLSPQWESIVADDGNDYVNVTGMITMYGDPTEILLQFRISGEAFELSAVELDGEGEPLFFGLELLGLMCADYAGG